MARQTAALLLTLFFGAVAARAEGPAQAPVGTLTLTNGGSVGGSLLPSDSTATLRWQATGFLQPFDFVTGCVAALRFPPENPVRSATGGVALNLVDGDYLTGDLLNWTDEWIELRTATFGDLRVRTDAVRRFFRLNGNSAMVLAGLSGLTDWHESRAGWHEDGRQLWTDQPGVAITADLNLPDRSMFEFVLSWSDSPNFQISFGIDPDAKLSTHAGWQIETWDSVLALLCERDKAADVDTIQRLSKETTRVQWRAYLDQTAGTLQLCAADGTLLASVSAPQPADNGPQGGFRLFNRKGDLRLESLRVTRWSGRLPTAESPGDARVERTDGTSLLGTIRGYDPSRHEFSLRSGDKDHSIPLDEVIQIEFTPFFQPRRVHARADLQDGTQVSGSLAAVEERGLQLRSEMITETLSIPIQSLRTLTLEKPGQPVVIPALIGRTGRLETEHCRLEGVLVDAHWQEGASCLSWQPEGSQTASALKPGVSGRVVYREVVTSSPPSGSTPPATPRPGMNFGNLFLKRVEDPVRKPVPTPHAIHLRSGDIVPCEISAINEEGVLLTTPVSDVHVVPHSCIKAAVLSKSAKKPSLKSVKKKRLLTLPRLQKASPPTHLLCSRTGDFLRCRLVDLDEGTLRVEMQLDEVEMPLARISHIIWFHPDELPREEKDGEAVAAAVASNSIASGDRVQVLRSDGNRMTFEAERVSVPLIQGHSPILGACEFRLGEVDQLIFGNRIDEAVATLDYQNWKLTPAIEPLVAQDMGDGSQGAGTISPLVGQPAPEINLELLSGGRFKLSECKGRLVVLDFWATWCGPCMQTMPLVEEMLREFDSEKVQLMSINLEESASQVSAVLERHALKVPVALDFDGVAARRYEANAIPQLVVVDQTGKIARLYIGGGPQMVEQLRAAIGELLESTAGAIPDPID